MTKNCLVLLIFFYFSYNKLRKISKLPEKKKLFSITLLGAFHTHT